MLRIGSAKAVDRRRLQNIANPTAILDIPDLISHLRFDLLTPSKLRASRAPRNLMRDCTEVENVNNTVLIHIGSCIESSLPRLLAERCFYKVQVQAVHHPITV